MDRRCIFYKIACRDADTLTKFLNDGHKELGLLNHSDARHSKKRPLLHNITILEDNLKTLPKSIDRVYS